MDQIKKRHRLSLRLQRFWAYLNLIWFGPCFILLLRCLGSYSCPERDVVRRRLEHLLNAEQGRPLLICANHLTMIDSMLLTWLLFDFKTLLLHFHRFPWNVPELQNFGGNILLRIMCYLGKCVYIERQGSAEARRLSWQKVSYLNAIGETLCIFPEGGRSRTGRLARENTVYGVGQLIQDNPRTLVLGVYLRGFEQKNYSFFPRRGERFFLDFRTCESPIQGGRRGQRDLTLHIMDQLEAMERDYLATRQ